MEQQQTPEQQLQEVQNRLVTSQSRSFELISSMTSERDEARTNTSNLSNILTAITTALGLENPTANDLLKEVNRLADLGKKGKK